MIYTSEKIQEIITSKSAKKALHYISPIYGDAEYFLRILNAIGTQLDVAWNFGQDMWNEIVPQTATKLIDLWEKEYGIVCDASKPLEERRNVLLQTIRSNPPMTPNKLEELLTAIPGIVARVEENTGKNKFTVWITSETDYLTEVRNIVNRSKPAHLAYELKYEMLAKNTVYYGCIVSGGKSITIRQVN